LKKISILLLLFSLLILASCSKNITNTNIKNIYVYHCLESSIPFEEYDIDFQSRKFTIIQREGFIDRPDEVKKDSPVKKSLSVNSIEEFINAVEKYGFLDWENEYENIRGLRDGHQWGIDITFIDGTKKEIKGSNNYPDTWNEMLIAFENLTGENVLYTKSDWVK